VASAPEQQVEGEHDQATLGLKMPDAAFGASVHWPLLSASVGYLAVAEEAKRLSNHRSSGLTLRQAVLEGIVKHRLGWRTIADRRGSGSGAVPIVALLANFFL
jgi:hypothetical protein